MMKNNKVQVTKSFNKKNFREFVLKLIYIQKLYQNFGVKSNKKLRCCRISPFRSFLFFLVCV